MRVLIAEDEIHNRQALSDVLRRLGHEPIVAEDGKEGLEIASKISFDAVFSDVRMPRMDGIQFFDSWRALCPKNEAMPPFVFMTAYGQLDEAVDAMRKGALHFMSKPLRKKDIVAALDEVSRVLASRRTAKARSDATPLFDPHSAASEAVFVSRAFAEAIKMVDKVAPTMASVLFVGESGTGKEILAQRLHRMSGREGGPFVAFHAGAMPETLLESELFGHEKGAFTGAHEARLGQIRAANHGTFFLDELSSMPLGTQAKLLRVLQDRHVQPLGASASVECDVRWVAATNTPLEPLVAEGRFREDLLYRLQVVVIDLPPLRDRPEDIEALANHFLSEFAVREGRDPLILAAPARSAMHSYSWPGNVRELRNLMERATALASPEERELALKLLPDHLTHVQQAREIRVAVGASLQSVEDKLIAETLLSCEGDKNKAAAILGVAPRTIYRWIERMGER